MILATIDGSDVEVLQDGFSIERTANGRDLLRCKVYSEDGSVRPGLDEEIILTNDAVSPEEIIFAGTITAARERGHAGVPDVPIETEVTATDYKALASRRFVNDTIVAGTLKEALEYLEPLIPGVTLDPAQVNGPSLEALTYSAAKVEDVLNDLSLLTGYVWEIDENKILRMYEPGDIPAPFNLTEAAQLIIGDVWVEPVRNSDYANRVYVVNATIAVVAEDAGEIATYGPWEAFYRGEDGNDTATLQALADAILARSLPILKTVEYTVDDLRLRPGMSQTINLPSRHVNNSFLLGDINIGFAPNGDLEELWATVQATEGLVYRTGFRETYKRWNAGGGRTVNAAGGSGGGGGTTSVRFAYFLGASGNEAVRSSGSPSPTWIPVSGGPDLSQGSNQVQINTVPRGTTAATVFVNLRALVAGQTVQARLYDVTDSTPCAGTSAVVTSLDADSDGITEWQFVSFGVTLTAGSHIYELQLLPGTDDADVQGVGYLE